MRTWPIWHRASFHSSHVTWWWLWSLRQTLFPNSFCGWYHSVFKWYWPSVITVQYLWIAATNIIIVNSSPPIYASVNRVSIGSDNGLSPIRRQAIIWTNAGILLIEPLGTKFSEMLIKTVHSRKYIWKCRLRNGGHFVQGRWVRNKKNFISKKTHYSHGLYEM